MASLAACFKLHKVSKADQAAIRQMIADHKDAGTSNPADAALTDLIKLAEKDRQGIVKQIEAKGGTAPTYKPTQAPQKDTKGLKSLKKKWEPLNVDYDIAEDDAGITLTKFSPLEKGEDDVKSSLANLTEYADKTRQKITLAAGVQQGSEALYKEAGFVEKDGALYREPAHPKRTSKYFQVWENSESVPIDDIIPRAEKTSEKTPGKTGQLMAAAAASGLERNKRPPVEVIRREDLDGTISIKLVDGNATYHEMKKLGETHLEVVFIKKPLQELKKGATIENLYEQAEEALQSAVDKTSQFARDTGGDMIVRIGAGLKDVQVATEKADRKYQGDVTRLGDIVGTTIVYETAAELKAGFKKIKDDYNVVSWDNRFFKEGVTGYRDIQLAVKADNGHVYEIQLNTRALVEAKHKFHDLYKVTRKIEEENVPKAIAKSVKAGLNSIMDTIYNAAFEISQSKPDTQRKVVFRKILLSAIEDSNAILSLVERSVISKSLSSDMRDILLSFRSKTNTSPSDSNKTVSGPSASTKRAARAPIVSSRGEVAGEAPASTNNIPIFSSQVNGDTGTLKLAKGKKLRYQYVVAPLKELIISHDPFNFDVNPAYPKNMQPRGRDSVSYQKQVIEIAQTLDPELLGANPVLAHGAPIVGPDGVVESGNGRAMAISRALNKKGKKAREYRKWLIENAYDFGLDAKDVKNIDQPVLVRVRTSELTEKERVALTVEAQDDNVARMTAIEQAKVDAVKLDNLDRLQVMEDGTIDNPGNEKFIRHFIDTVVPASEQGDMRDKKGQNLSKNGRERIINAIFVKAYGGESEVADLALSSTENNIKNATNGMLTAAPRIAKLRDGVAQGAYFDRDISGLFADAVEDYANIKRKGSNVAYEISQQNMYSAGRSPEHVKILEYLDRNKRSGKKIADFLKAYANRVISRGDPRQASLTEKGPLPPIGTLIDEAIARVEPKSQQQTITGQVEEGGVKYEVQHRRKRKTTTGGKQMSLFTSPTVAPAEKKKAIRQTWAKVANAESGVFYYEGDTAETAAKIAQIAAPIMDEAQENNLIIMTDKDHKPVAVLKHAYGTTSRATVEMSKVLGVAHALPEVKNLWFAHNHPSGGGKLSDADKGVIDGLRKASRNTGINTRMMIAVTPTGKFVASTGPDISETWGEITAPITSGKSVKQLRRKIIKTGNQGAVNNPQQLRLWVKKNAKDATGVLLLNTQNEPVAFVPVSLPEMQNLRTGEKGTGASDILAAAHESNATRSAVISAEMASATDLENVLIFLRSMDLGVLDTVIQGEALGGHLVNHIFQNTTRQPFEFYSKKKTSGPKANVAGELSRKLGPAWQKIKGQVKIIATQEEARRIIGTANALYATAFHGTPARDITNFSTDYMSSGEGYQMYGWGLYFASEKEVAEYYREALSEFDVYRDGKKFEHSDPEVLETLRSYQRGILTRSQAANVFERTESDNGHGIPEIAEDIRQGRFSRGESSGQVYKVEVPEKEDLLDWDKPLNQQPPRIKKALLKAIEEKVEAKTRKSILDNADRAVGAYVYKNIAMDMGTAEAASKYLNEAGVKGIRYLDQFSRRDGRGTHNFVIFDGADTQITEVLYSEDGAIQGFYKDGIPYLVEDGIEAGQAWPVLLHELGSHQILESLFTGKAWDGITSMMAKAEKLDGATGKAVRAAKARIPEKTPMENRDREWVAYYLENNANQKQGLWRRIIAAIKGALLKMGVNANALRLTPDDLVTIAKTAIRKGNTKVKNKGGAYFSRTPVSNAPESILGGPGQSRLDKVLQLSPKNQDLWERAVFYWADKDDPRRRVLARTGKTHSLKTDILTTERLRGKKTADDVEQNLMEKRVKPLLKGLVNDGIEIKEAEDYAYALHVPERNERMRQVNAKRYIDKIKAHLNTEETAALVSEMIDVRSTAIMTGAPRGELQDEYLRILDELFYDVNRMQDKLSLEQAALNDRVYTAAEIAKGTPFRKQKEIDNRQAHIDAIEKIQDDWDLRSPRFAGITDGQAQEILDKVNADPRKDGFIRFQQRLAEINRFRLDSLYEAGQLTPEEYRSLVDGYEYYVPLHRDPEQVGYTDTPPPTGRITGATGKPLKVAKGSLSDVVEILAHSVNNAQQAVVRKHKAEAGKALYNFVKENPDVGITLDEQRKSPTHDREGNIVMYESPQEADNELFVRVDGKRYTLTFDVRDKTAMRMVKSIKDSDAGLQGPMRALSKFTRFLASVNTMYSPEFIPTNFMRDFQSAGFNMADSVAKGLQGKVAKSVFPAIKGIIGAEFKGNNTSYWGQAYRDFAKHGGKIGWMQGYEEIADLSKNLEKELRLLEGKNVPKKAWNNLKKLVEKTNVAIENGVRLATYQHAVEVGVPKDKAALAASNLTVDFTRRGTGGPAINALYMFFNASIQGNIRMIKAITRSRKVQALVGGIIGTGMAMQFLAYMTGGDDETGEPKIDGVPDWIKERNMVFINQEGKMVQIPMAYGYSVFYSIGQEIARAMHTTQMRGKEYDAGKGAMRLFNAAMGSFNPLGSGDIFQTISPTALDIPAMIYGNRSWNGAKLMPEGNIFDVAKARAYRFWRSASTPARWIAQTLHKYTGGKEGPYAEAAIDVSPEWIDLFYDSLTGSAGKFAKNTLMLPIDVARGKEISERNVPFVRRFYGKWDDRAISNRYYEEVKRLRRFELNAKSPTYQRNEDYARDLALVQTARATKLRIKKLKSARRKAEEAGRPVDDFNDKILATQVRFLKRMEQMK